MKKILLAVLVLAFSIPAAGQQEEEEEVIFSDAVMEQIVRRVVARNFKPSRRPRTVYFAEQMVKPEWLPEIRNVEFVLLKENDAIEEIGGVHFFFQIKRDGDEYEVWYGFGIPGCKASGQIWKVKFVHDRTRIWRKTNAGWGSGCAVGAGQ